jgi:protein gp37
MLLTKRITAMSAYFLGHGGARYVMPSCQLPNLWLGVTVCNQDEIMWKAEELGEIPAVVKFLCLEPLLDDVDQHGKLSYLFKAGYIAAPPAGRINWVIVGPETGPNRRPCKIEWIRSIVQQCRAAGVPVWRRFESEG